MRMNWRLDPSRLLLALSKEYRPGEKFTTHEAKQKGLHIHAPHMYYLHLNGLLAHDHITSGNTLVNRYWIPTTIHRKIQEYEDEIHAIDAGDKIPSS